MFRTNELQTFYKHGFVGTSQKSAYNINAGKIKNPENPMISGLRAFDFLIPRRERDSNPRRCDPQRFSRPPQSTALPSLLEALQYPACAGKGNNYFAHDKNLPDFLNPFINRIFYTYFPWYREIYDKSPKLRQIKNYAPFSAFHKPFVSR